MMKVSNSNNTYGQDGRIVRVLQHTSWLYLKSAMWLVGLVSTGVPMCPGCNLWGGGGCLWPTELAVKLIYRRPHRHAHSRTIDPLGLHCLSLTLWECDKNMTTGKTRRMMMMITIYWFFISILYVILKITNTNQHLVNR